MGKSIILRGTKHKVSDRLAGFTIKETPASTNVSLYAFNKQTKELLVIYRRPNIEVNQYMFSEVSDSVLKEITEAKSIGLFLHNNVKDKFQHEMIAEELFTIVDKTKSPK